MFRVLKYGILTITVLLVGCATAPKYSRFLDRDEAESIIAALVGTFKPVGIAIQDSYIEKFYTEYTGFSISGHCKVKTGNGRIATGTRHYRFVGGGWNIVTGSEVVDAHCGRDQSSYDLYGRFDESRLLVYYGGSGRGIIQEFAIAHGGRTIRHVATISRNTDTGIIEKSRALQNGEEKYNNVYYHTTYARSEPNSRDSDFHARARRQQQREKANSPDIFGAMVTGATQGLAIEAERMQAEQEAAARRQAELERRNRRPVPSTSSSSSSSSATESNTSTSGNNTPSSSKSTSTTAAVEPLSHCPSLEIQAMLRQQRDEKLEKLKIEDAGATTYDEKLSITGRMNDAANEYASRYQQELKKCSNTSSTPVGSTRE